MEEPRMSIKSILAVAAGGPGDHVVLDTALSLARPFAARIVVLHVKIDPRTAIPMVGEGMSSAVIADVMESIERQAAVRARQAREAFEAWRIERGIAAVASPEDKTSVGIDWKEMVGRPAETPALAGRVHDLIVAGRDGGDEPTAAAAIEACLFSSGRPVLVAPRVAPTRLGRRIAVFWNGSAQAARAVSDAIAVMERTERVVVLDSGETAGEAPTAADLIARLHARGIPVSGRSVEPRDGMGAALAAAAAEEGCDLVVMGAYSHSRLRQLILGGVTRHMLGAANLPVFMSH
jgi:nucleotide-binding universal stress UspA family protein